MEAIPTITLGFLSFIVLPDMPETAGRWLTAEEKDVAIQRTRQSGNTDEHAFDKKQFLAALVDYKVWFAGSYLIDCLITRILIMSTCMISCYLHWFEHCSRQFCCISTYNYS